VSERQNQKRRTRKHLLETASRLMAEGRDPSLEEIAEAALVSRATAYRYFPNVEALLVEASLDIAMPDPQALFDGITSEDPLVRLERADAAMHDVIMANEAGLRRMMVHALQQSLAESSDEGPPARQNRRTPLIDAALAPARKDIKPAALPMLRQALALVMGTEAMLVCKDVLQLDDAQTRKVKRWAIRALLQAAQKA
jgi:AcrR family transcriptional regulator